MENIKSIDEIEEDIYYQKETYQGWTNRETWALNLHLTNTEGIYNDFMSIVKSENFSDYEKENNLKDWVEDLIYNFFENNQEMLYFEEIKNLIQDVGSLWRVNYKEIINSNKED